jgi:O-6-methylguanine DNA methyltransferase
MSFSEKVYKVVSKIPSGKVMSYSAVASKAGSPGASRAVGSLMARNPNPGTGPGKVPCHRVVSSDGSLGGFSGKNGPEGKLRLLRNEGIKFRKSRISKECFL